MSAPSGYKHLNYHMRDWLSILYRQGYSCRQIAAILGKHHTTISRELQRNSITRYGKMKYVSHIAHEKYVSRFRSVRAYKIDKSAHLQTFIYNKLKETWSPEMISGHLTRIQSGISISHETIYRYIYKSRRDWIQLLARGLKRRRRKSIYQKRTKTLIPERISIDSRPNCVNTRKEFGHFEVDTMVTRQSKYSILIILERKTRLIKLRKLHNRSSELVKAGIVKALDHYKPMVKSITYDNGLENALHREVNTDLGCISFFCNPYHSWEKGSVENAIGLIRRFIPKKRDIASVSDEELKRIERIINGRPRKILDFDSSRNKFDTLWCTYG